MGCGTNFAKSFYCLIAEYPSTNLHKNSVYCIRDTIPVVGTAIMSGDVRQLFGLPCPSCVPIAAVTKKKKQVYPRHIAVENSSKQRNIQPMYKAKSFIADSMCYEIEE